MKDCCMFDLQNNQWRRLPDLIEKRANAAVFAIENEYLYAFGGFYTQSSAFFGMDTIERLNFKTNSNTWEKFHISSGSIPFPRIGCLTTF